MFSFSRCFMKTTVNVAAKTAKSQASNKAVRSATTRAAGTTKARSTAARSTVPRPSSVQHPKTTPHKKTVAGSKNKTTAANKTNTAAVTSAAVDDQQNVFLMDSTDDMGAAPIWTSDAEEGAIAKAMAAAPLDAFVVPTTAFSAWGDEDKARSAALLIDQMVAGLTPTTPSMLFSSGDDVAAEAQETLQDEAWRRAIQGM